ncbi:PQQ-dependent dehydrogenase, methanol/ethanol family [uncultured Paraglaciecola sp.]|uniref:PQQ-dependent dehydrogenase, methanol/ethanol family n=1 Tax=uncultured Paraglaciecola sp. TaxID=1765024 RepID=UPI00260F5BC6|nr:PQQ-dependent dehydrogenase, methanol/ethanol family [uncultured Paraglaciecola sp.]
MYKILTFLSLSLIFLCGCDRSESVAQKPLAADSKIRAEANLVTSNTIIQADDSGWLSHGRTYSEQRHSPLQAINTKNVADLGLLWSYDLGTSRGIEATPIVHNGMMYVTSTWNIVHALDARTGKQIWQFDPVVDKEQAGKACCDAVNRGVAIWGDAVFTATIDGRLISLDAKTGAKNWDINTIDKTYPYTITGAPRIVKGKVLIGNGGAELGVRGYISAYDVENGNQLWRFYTVPGNPADGFENATMEMAAKTWTGKYWAAGGGGTAWDSMAYDPKLDLLYVGVGNGTPWNHAIRSPDGGDNLFLSSIVALRPDTGEYVWHYQTTPAESWDYTATQHMILADLKIDGVMRNVIMQAPKNGFFYVLDRATGEFISAKNFVPVTWATHIDETTGRPVETPEARFVGKAPNMQLPGPLGAHNWHPMSYSPDTGLVYIPAQEAPHAFVHQEDYKNTNGFWNTGTEFGDLPNDKATIKALKSMLKGRLLAWDPIAQKAAWTVEHQGPWNGGVLSTSGGLVFQGTADAHFGAYDALTGEQKWRFYTQTGVVAAPITYELDGEQFVAIASGWGGSYVLSSAGVFPTGSQANVGRVLVFKLGAKNALPPLLVDNFETPEPPKMLEVSDETLAKGARAFANNCLVCHGALAYSSGLIPNLRYSAITSSKQAWKAVVIEGALAQQGMPNFSKRFDAETAEAIRAYVISVANSE